MKEKTFKEKFMEEVEDKKDALTKVWNAVDPRNEYRSISKEVLFFTHTDLFKLLFPVSWAKKKLSTYFAPRSKLRQAELIDSMQAELIDSMQTAAFEIFMFLVIGAIIALCYWAWHRYFGEPPVEVLP